MPSRFPAACAERRGGSRHGGRRAGGEEGGGRRGEALSSARRSQLGTIRFCPAVNKLPVCVVLVYARAGRVLGGKSLTSPRFIPQFPETLRCGTCVHGLSCLAEV